ncbi:MULTISPECIES: helix-turn-helix domain-containing protein [Isoptericola]|uniref:Helix-turn-helix domain-containing protein n=1 Tax=Isoptericola haloaureus TaxID=1542902 RepID=A0ABU7Z3W2_9MICO|nr:helix-turn-helix domain-containing protein [Isoptericola sp. AK164]
MTAVVEHTVLPPRQESELVGLLEVLESTDQGALVAPDGTQVSLPGEVYEVLQDVVRAMVRGQAITVAPHHTVMTTQAAADFLGVSRPTLVRMLEEGQIPYTQPSRHRRVLLADLVEYQERTRRDRRELLDEMTRESAGDANLGSGFVSTR